MKSGTIEEDWFQRRPNLSLDEFTDTLNWYIKVVNVDRYSNEFTLAYGQMKSIDPNNAEFLASALLISYLVNYGPKIAGLVLHVYFCSINLRISKN